LPVRGAVTNLPDNSSLQNNYRKQLKSMYLSHTVVGLSVRYSIRKSFYDETEDSYTYREIYDLGDKPSEYIERLADNAFCFNEELEEAVSLECKGDPTVVLEDLLQEFLPHEEMRRGSNFRRRSYRKLSVLTPDEIEELHKNIHIFDRRRLYYIRYGAVDQSRIYRVNEKLYRPLLYKCRDEKEFYIKNLERSLKAVDFKKYIYVIFNLQKDFSESYSAFMPEALIQKNIDDSFLREVCRLNKDQMFWQDGEYSSFLRYHLRDYVMRFFDSDFQGRSFAYDYYRSFRSQHRNFRWPERREKISDDETSEAFGEKIDILRSLKKSELARLFRRKAKEHHPDSGGEPERFIKLLAAYEELKRKLFS